MNARDIYEKVNDRYSAASKGTSAEYGHSVATAFGYSAEELAGIPKDANLGLSCGNPLAMASLREGETVIDLGSGAGLDVFIAANKVGADGKVFGVDMNREMLARANKLKAQSSMTNVEFVESKITDIDLDSGIADCIISNCVINLVPEEEKQLVFNEMLRLLKPGGRVALSDILTKKPLPEKLKTNIALYVGCIAGAGSVGRYEQYLKEAGFGDTIIADTHSDLNIYFETNPDGTRTAGGTRGSTCRSETGNASSCKSARKTCCSGLDKSSLGEYADADLNDWAGSYKIYAVKPSRQT